MGSAKILQGDVNFTSFCVPTPTAQKHAETKRDYSEMEVCEHG